MHSKGIVKNPLSRNWRIVIALIVALLVASPFLFFGSGSGKSQVKKNTVHAMVRPEDRQWQLCWKKPPSAKSLDPQVREKCNPARIERLDNAYFTIVAIYEHQWVKHQAVLNWKKAKDKSGDWSQPAPKAKGTWKMTQVSPDLYNGWYKDAEDGEEGLLWLQAVK